MHAADLTTAPVAPSDRGGLTLSEKIDVCRGVFVALVVSAHAFEIAWGAHPGVGEGMSGFALDVVWSLAGTGTYYVMGFFVLSGYCIQRSTARAAGTGPFPVRSYAVARLSRILPLYYLALLGTVVVEWAIAGARPRAWPHGLDAGTLLGQLVMVQNLTQTFGSFAPSWSLTNEVFYYALYAVLVRASAGRPAVAAWAGLGVCGAVAVVTQTLYVTAGRSPLVYRTGMLLGLGMLWFLGALLAVHGEALVARAGVRRLARSWPVVLAAAVAYRIAHLPPQGVYLISGSAFALMLLSFLGAGPVAAPADSGRLRGRVVATLGLSSYPAYLFHGPLLMLVGSWVMRSGAVADWRATWALLVGVGLVSGALMGWFLERPVMAWRAAMLRRWKEGEPRGVASSRPAVVPGPTAAGVSAVP